MYLKTWGRGRDHVQTWPGNLGYVWRVSKVELRDERWEPTETSGVRRARMPVDIRAYVPAELCDLELKLAVSTPIAVSDAEHRIQAAQAHAESVGVSTIAAHLLRSEAIASSQLEGVSTPSHRALAKALIKAETEADTASFSAPAAATVANVNAVRGAYQRAVAVTGPMTVADIRKTHAALSRADLRLA